MDANMGAEAAPLTAGSFEFIQQFSDCFASSIINRWALRYVQVIAFQSHLANGLS